MMARRGERGEFARISWTAASGYQLTIQDTPVRVRFDSECRPIPP
jgi:hypothetical protein